MIEEVQLSPEVVASFWHCARPDPHSSRGCWLWRGSQYPTGYGFFGCGNGIYKATHVSWEIHRGHAPPADRLVLHKCDNPECTNPDHLFLGTHADNMKDKSAKGRHHPRAIAVGRKAVRELREIGYVSIDEAIRTLDTLPEHVRRAIQTGVLTAVRVLGKRFIPEDALRAWSAGDGKRFVGARTRLEQLRERERLAHEAWRLEQEDRKTAEAAAG